MRKRPEINSYWFDPTANQAIGRVTSRTINPKMQDAVEPKSTTEQAGPTPETTARGTSQSIHADLGYKPRRSEQFANLVVTYRGSLRLHWSTKRHKRYA